METYTINGELKDLAVDYTTGTQTLSFALRGDFRPAYDEFTGKELTIEIKRFRKHRSKDANALFHLMVGRIADALEVSKPFCKNILISRYGQQEFLDDGTEVVIKTNIPPENMMELENLHCIPIKGEDNVTWYRVYRGTHTYDAREMSILIDGTVEEAKGLGVETPTSKEMRMALNEWEKHHNK